MSGAAPRATGAAGAVAPSLSAPIEAPSVTPSVDGSARWGGGGGGAAAAFAALACTVLMIVPRIKSCTPNLRFTESKKKKGREDDALHFLRASVGACEVGFSSIRRVDSVHQRAHLDATGSYTPEIASSRKEQAGR